MKNRDVMALRARAEAVLARRGERRHDDDVARVIHELEAHQLELEMQHDELRRTQEALEIANRRYRALFEDAPIGYVTLDEEGIIGNANLTAAVLLGIPVHRLETACMAASVHPDDVPAFLRFLNRVLAVPVRHSYVIRFLHAANNETLTLRLDAVADLPLADPGKRSTRMAMFDISELVEAERALAASEAKTQAIVDTAGDAIITIDEHSRIASFNRAAEDLFGYTAETAVGLDVRALLADPTTALEDGHGVLGAVRADGSEIAVEVSMGEVELTSGRLKTAILRDVQERKVLEQMREDLMERVMAAHDEERRRLARELHDETGQALTSLTVGLEQLKGASDVGTAQDQATKLQRLLSSIIAGIGRLSRGLHPQLLDELGLRAAIDQHVAEHADLHGIRYDIEEVGLEGTKLPKRVERAVFRFVQEALLNVVKHANAHHVHVVLQRRGDNLCAVVEDDGRGFDVTTPRAGLGLTAMKERARHVHALLDVDSTPGVGTTLTLVVPLPSEMS